MSRPYETNHILHLLLSVFTLGLWLPVWAIVAFQNGRARRAMAIRAASTPAAAAWYPDPQGEAPERWWDGSAWTRFTRGA